jgi:hypothetical protein
MGSAYSISLGSWMTTESILARPEMAHAYTSTSV